MYSSNSLINNGVYHTVFFIKGKRDLTISKLIYKLLILLIINSFFQQILAHEMWLEPVQFEISKGDKLFAHEKVGQVFKGNEYVYLDSNYATLNYTINDVTHSLSPRLGSLPVIQMIIDEEGLLILSAITSPSKLTYKDQKTFTKFLQAESLQWVSNAHKERGLPETGFTEVYRRFPKSLVKVGKGLGHDKYLGLPLEWVALSNPYQESDEIKLQLLWQGKPYAGVKKVNVFNKFQHKTSDGTLENKVTQTKYATDEHGILTLPLKSNSLYLVSAVKMIEPDPNTRHKYNAVWESLWASMTFEVPKNSK